MSKDIEAKDNHAYFESYSFIDIHESMLKDKARTEAYRDAMFANKALFEGATVLDIGCGTGRRQWPIVRGQPCMTEVCARCVCALTCCRAAQAFSRSSRRRPARSV